MLPALRKTIVISILVFLLMQFMLPSRALAASNFLNTNPDVVNNLHNKTQVALIEVSATILCQLIGIDIINPAVPCLGVDPLTSKIGYQKYPDGENRPRIGGAIGATINMIGMTYAIPVHTGDYVSYVASSFGIIKPAYAQETGFNNLSALLDLWKRFRDLSYMAFVLIFVIIGLGIMLRVKLDPKAVMSLQNQIPKVIVSIVLITFSYAIAGFLVDMMWVTTYTGINLISGNTTCTDGTTLAEKATLNLMETPLRYVDRVIICPFKSIVGFDKHGLDKIAANVSQTVGDIITDVLFSLMGLNDVAESPCKAISPSTWGNCITKAFFGIISWLVGVVAKLIIGIAILVQLVRIWFALIKNYIYIILYTLLSPFYILLGLFPGSAFGFTAWIRRIVFALSVFPVTVFLFVIAAVLATDPRINNPMMGSGESFSPPLVGNPGIHDNMGILIALGVILLAPEVINMMRDLMKTPPSKYAAAIPSAIGVGQSVATAPISKSWGSLTARDSSGQARGPIAFAVDNAVGNITRKAVDKLGTGRIGQFVNTWRDRRYGYIDAEAAARAKAKEDAEAAARAKEEAKAKENEGAT